MSPRNSAAGAAATREAIVAEAVGRASIEGLEGITIGKLAASLGMSKAGVVGGFGDKEAIQLAAVAAAVEIYRREIWDPAEAADPGIARLRAIAEAWMSYLERDVFPGGCFMTAVSVEFDDRPGPVRDAILAALDRWDSVLAHEAKAAVAAGDLPADTDPTAIAFAMNGIAMATNQAHRLRRDPAAGDRGRAAMERLLG
jgi:AcrR family transcriptional regulator